MAQPNSPITTTLSPRLESIITSNTWFLLYNIIKHLIITYRHARRVQIRQELSYFKSSGRGGPKHWTLLTKDSSIQRGVRNVLRNQTPPSFNGRYWWDIDGIGHRS